MATALYLVASCLTIVAYYALDRRLADSAFVVAPVVGLLGLIIGPRIHQPASALPWRWLAAGQVAFVIGNMARLISRVGGPAELSWMSEFGYLGYLFLAIGLMAFIRVRRPQYRLARLVDGLALGASATLAVLVYTVELLPTGPEPTGILGVLITPLFAALFLGATAYLVIAGGGVHGRAHQLLLLGAGLTAAAHVAYNVWTGSSSGASAPLETAWMVSYLVFGLAALSPSMRQLTEPQVEEPGQAAGRGMLALAAGVVVLTVVNLAAHVSAHSGVGILEFGGVLLIALLFVRAREAAGREAARERSVAVLLAHAADALLVVDVDGRIRVSNPAAASVFGLTEAAFARASVFDLFKLVHPDERAELKRRLVELAQRTDAVDRAIVRIAVREGGYRSIDMHASNRSTDPVVAGVVLNFHDVTGQVQADADLLRLGTAIEQASDAVVVTDVEGRIEYVNPAFEEISGYGREEVIGQNPRILKSGEQPPIFYDTMWQTLTSGKPWRADFVNRRKDGTAFRMVGVITPLRDEAGRLTGYVGVQRDVTQQRELETTAHRIARERALVAETVRNLDPREPPEKIAQSVCNQLVAINGVTLAALFVYEADGRAAPYGFAVANGEPVRRRRLAGPRTTQLRERTGDGPFIEAWRDRPGHPYNELIARLGTRAHAYAPVRDGGRAIGFIVVGSAADDAEDALTDSLSAIVECAEIAGKLMSVKVHERTERSSDRLRITQVIDRHQFFPVFQPLCETVTERVVGYEALTRFEDGVAPDIYFAEAYEAGVGEKLELAAIEAALKGAADIPQGMWLNINATPDVIMDGGGLQRLLSSSDRDLVLEVTEHVQITDYQAFRQALLELGPRVRLAVDDAGAGFASLRHILELRPAFVKLDRQVVMGIDDDEARQAMVAGLHHFAQNTGCWLIGEGVETPAELSALRGLGVRYVQGYLLGRPVPLGLPSGHSTAAQAADGGDVRGVRRRPR